MKTRMILLVAVLSTISVANGATTLTLNPYSANPAAVQVFDDVRFTFEVTGNFNPASPIDMGVDWGDGASSTTPNHSTMNTFDHVFSTVGVFTIKAKSTIEGVTATCTQTLTVTDQNALTPLYLMRDPVNGNAAVVGCPQNWSIKCAKIGKSGKASMAFATTAAPATIPNTDTWENLIVFSVAVDGSGKATLPDGWTAKNFKISVNKKTGIKKFTLAVSAPKGWKP